MHPCGDESAELPGVFEDAPLITDGGRVCYARGSEATLMYWGGRDRMSEIVVQLLGRMDGAGWAQYQSDNPYAPRPDPEKPVYVFRKGKEEIGVRIHPAKTPRFGAKFDSESLTFYVSHRTLTEKDR